MDRFSYKERSMTPLGQRLIEDIRLATFRSTRSKPTCGRWLTLPATTDARLSNSMASRSAAYLLYLVQERKVSWSLYNQTRCAFAGTADLRFPSSWRKASQGLSRKCQFVRFVLSLCYKSNLQIY